MIEKLTEYSRHVQDEATVTADLLNDAAALLKDAATVITQLITAYQKTLRVNGYEADSESIHEARKVWYRLHGITMPD